MKEKIIQLFSTNISERYGHFYGLTNKGRIVRLKDSTMFELINSANPLETPDLSPNNKQVWER